MCHPYCSKEHQVLSIVQNQALLCNLRILKYKCQLKRSFVVKIINNIKMAIGQNPTYILAHNISPIKPFLKLTLCCWKCISRVVNWFHVLHMATLRLGNWGKNEQWTETVDYNLNYLVWAPPSRTTAITTHILTKHQPRLITLESFDDIKTTILNWAVSLFTFDNHMFYSSQM